MILAVLQARMSSSRLPGKVLKPLLGVPMLLRQIERIRRAKSIDTLLVATSSDASDDAIADLCRVNSVECFRGSLNDVLDRFYQIASQLRPEHVMRLTGDCPLIDPEVIDQVADFYHTGNYDYASNAVEPTFPDGLDVEIFRFACLEAAWNEARRASEREHVTLFIYTRPERFRIGYFKIKTNLSHFRWTVDEPADFDFVSEVYQALYPTNPRFTMHDVLRYLDAHPEVAMVNAGTKRNEGLMRSLDRDRHHGG